MLDDLSRGAARFNSFHRWLARICAIGWMGAIIAGFTGLLPLIVFALWIAPLSTYLVMKALLNSLERDGE